MRRPSTRDLIKNIEKKHGFRTKKKLGQCFLADDAALEAIADACGLTESSLAVEIGPGVGVLTAALAERAGRVCAVELDSELIPVLADTLSGYGNVGVINADILEVDLPALIAEQGALIPGGADRAVVAGNLPYYITTPIITGLLESGVPADAMIFMVQKEVADRLAASPGSKDYGVLTVTVTYYCEVKKVLDVGKEAFIPSPKVDSAVVQLTPKGDGRVRAKDDELFFRLVKAGFSQRRKTLINALTGGGFGKEEALAAMEAAGIDPKRRAETLSVADFVRLSDAMGG
ncbi:MAG: 16S rRNA (adenine(1518)-N(6)/adenine(1519)-N(6))-dimethyltransferase RsmA [Firmicutes bacterium]|nr:16S rRNA (adenine(1518)-N(6)/adenine(1519)-N(6))-dimethyltransferase RsmA [Bacillota bacterium]